MARIYKKNNKKGVSWGYVIYAGTDPITGKDRRIYKQGFRTQKDAKLAASIIENQLDRGTYIEPSQITLNELFNDWLKHYNTQVKESSVRARKIAFNHILNEHKNTPIQKITKKNYQDTIDLLADKFSKNYIDSIHSTANMVFDYAVKTKLIKISPTKETELPKKQITVEELEKGIKITDKYLEKEELEAFLTVVKNEGLEGDLLTFVTLAYTGLRIGELVSLKFSDIDFKKNTLTVYRTYYNPTNNKLKYKLLTPKTKSSHRTIRIDEIVIELLKKHQEEQNIIKKNNKPFYKDNGFIFATNEGYPKTIKAISIRLQRLIKKTRTKIAQENGLKEKDVLKKDITPHSFRHTHTSLLIEADTHIKEIQERLGHSDIKTTMDIYAHMTKNMKKEASTKFSNLMKNLSKNLIE